MSNGASDNSALVVIPTYNDFDNLTKITSRVLSASDHVDILIVDDNSPDGTGRLADQLASASNRISVLHRHGKSGIGDAYRAGFGWGLRQGYEFLVELYGDGSHRHDQLPALLDAIRTADVVLGSRWVAGGYRAFRAAALAAIHYGSTRARGNRFQFELLWRARSAGLVIREVPIDVAERRTGDSRMSPSIILEALTRVAIGGIVELPRRVVAALGGPVVVSAPRRAASLLDDGPASTPTQVYRGLAPAHGVDGRD
jgi:dolichol-phosphate mannosyltransferase